MYIYFKCRTFDGTNFRLNLHIFADEATCLEPNLDSAVKMGQLLKFNCSFDFRGLWAPTVSWSTSRSLGTATSSESGRTTSTGHVLRAITLTAAESLHNTTLTSHVHFAAAAGALSPAPPADGATNVPNFSFNWTSSVIIAITQCK